MSFPADADLPGQSLRTALSFLIFLHLFALFVGMSSNEQSSALEQQLRTVPGVERYLQALSMDLSYNFNLTYGPDIRPGSDGRPTQFATEDDDQWIEADLTRPDGTKVHIELPEPGVMPLQRMRRYRSLAFHATSLAPSAETQPQAGYLFKGIAMRLVREHKATGGRIRSCWRRPDQEAYATTRERMVAIEYDILVGADGIELLRVEAKGEAAPTAQPSAK